MATIFAWTGALHKRAELDDLPELSAFAAKLEKAALATIESGTVTGDLKDLVRLPEVQVADTEDFLRAIAARLA